jgi:hypothetical protein
MPNTILSINDLETVTGGAIRSSSSGLGVGGLGTLGSIGSLGATGGILPLLLQQQQQQLQLACSNNNNNMLPLMMCMMAMNKPSRPAFFSQGPFGYSWQT